jgi:transcriptional regulator with XRE-family HTH domain
MARTALHPAGDWGALRAARRERGWSQEVLAAKVGLDARSLGRIERGEVVPHPDTIGRLSRCLGRSPRALGLLPASATGRPVQRPAGEPPPARAPAPELAALLSLTQAVASRESDDQPGHAHADTAALRAFRAADPQLGGAHLYGAVVRYLEGKVAPRLFGRVRGDRGPDVFCVAAALTDMAGWMAHDAGRDTTAEQHFARAQMLAQAGDDPELEANVLASRSHLAHQLGKVAEALALATAGQAALRRGRRNPGLAARLHALGARGWAVQRDGSECLRLLGQAERALAAAAPPAVSECDWTNPFDEASLAGEAALALRQLGRFGPARLHAERVIALRVGDRVRSRAFALMTLAGVFAEQRRLDDACAMGHQVLQSTVALGSLRVVQQLHALRQLLTPHRSAKAVGDFLACSADELRGRTALYHWLDDGSAPPAA